MNYIEDMDYMNYGLKNLQKSQPPGLRDLLSFSLNLLSHQVLKGKNENYFLELTNIEHSFPEIWSSVERHLEVNPAFSLSEGWHDAGSSVLINNNSIRILGVEPDKMKLNCKNI